MTDVEPQSKSQLASALLLQWLSGRIGDENTEWLLGQIDKTLQSNSNRDLHITLGLIPRKLTRCELALSDAELDQAETVCTGWNPSNWSVDAAARVAVLCRLASHSEEKFTELLPDLFRNADLAESIACYSGVALYPQSDSLDWQIGEGLRTNMRAVFEAIAHHNPYPALHFDQNRWNHLVLKALFIESTLAPIYGLDERANPELALILCDYAHERWAAGRPVSPELWRCVGRFATGTMVDDLQHAAAADDVLEKKAGVLALSQCSDASAQRYLHEYPELVSAITSGDLSWHSLYSHDVVNYESAA